jgi:hypothetical protein
MQEKTNEAVHLSPERLLSGFSKGHMAKWIVIAAAIHVVVIGSLSVSYIRDQWIDPRGAEARKVAAKAAQDALKKAAAKAVAGKAGAGAAAGASGAVARASSAAATGAVANAAAGGDEIPEDRRNAPVVKRITESAKPGEIPKQPGEIGISIEDTNLH